MLNYGLAKAALPNRKPFLRRSGYPDHGKVFAYLDGIKPQNFHNDGGGDKFFPFLL
jgi:hypothetical protein